MTEEDAKPIRNFVVIVDTNAIWTKEDSVELLPPDFREKWAPLSVAGDVQLKIPYVVVRELAYRRERHFLRKCQDARAGVDQVNAALGLELPAVPKIESIKVREAILAKLREQLEATPYCREEEVPYTKVAEGLRGIVAASLWRLPPFKEKGEGGFRDSLILETVAHIHAQEPHSDIAFITKDDRLIVAAQERFKGISNFGIFSALHEYEKFLELARVRFPPDLLHELTTKAGDIFEDAAWFNLDLETRVRKDFELKIGAHAFDGAATSSPKPAGALGGLGGIFALGSTMRRCSGEPEFHFLKTELLGVVGSNEFHWSSTVLITTPYREPPGLLSGALEGKGPAYMRLLQIAVEWRAIVDSRDPNHGFSKIGVIAINKEFDMFVED